MSGWGTLTGEAHYTLSSLGHSNDPQKRMGAFNWRAYKNERLDKVLQDAAIELDNGKRKALLEEANRLFMADRPSLPLVSVGSAWTYQKAKVKMLRVRVDEDTLAYDIAPAN
jgi:peptide/nickel transport system substrate-binding protein